MLEIGLINTVNDASHTQLETCATVAISSALKLAGNTNAANLLDDKISGCYKAIMHESHKYAVATGPNKKDAPVIGISTSTQDYHKAIFLSMFFRKFFPGSRIIGGGPHFTIETAQLGLTSYSGLEDSHLEGYNRAFDGVVIGNAQPFIDLVEKHKGDLEKVNSPGFYRLDENGNMVGHGFGTSIRVSRLPYALDYDEIRLTLRDFCNNRCDFCSVQFKRKFHGLTDEQVLEGLEEIVTKHPKKRIKFGDSNPFIPSEFPYYEEMFRRASKRFQEQSKAMYIDPTLLTDPEYRKRILEFAQKYKVDEFSIGRDSATEKNAEFIGTKSKGKVKTQKQLDEEKLALLKFLSESKDLFDKAFVHYVLSPIEDQITAQITADEMEEFESIGKKVYVRSYIAVPEPGTRLREKYREHIRRPNEFWTHSTWINPWDYSLGTGAYLLDKIEELKLYEDRIPSEQLRIAAKKTFGKKNKPKPLGLKRRFTKGMETFFYNSLDPKTRDKIAKDLLTFQRMLMTRF